MANLNETIYLKLIAETKDADKELGKVVKTIRKVEDGTEKLVSETRKLGNVTTEITKKLVGKDQKEKTVIRTITKHTDATKKLSQKTQTLIRNTSKLGKVVAITTNRYGQMIKTFDDGKGMITRVNTTTKALVSQVQDLDRGFMGTGDHFGKIVKKVLLWTASTGVIFGVIRAIQQLANELLVLEKAMARVATVTRPESGSFGTLQATIKEMHREVLDFASDVPAKIDDVAQVLYYLGSAGLSVKEQLEGMDHIANLAIGTWGDMGEIARTVAGIVNNFGDSIAFAGTEEEKFDYVTDLIAKTFSEQQVEISEISDAFQLAGSAADLMDISLQELVGTVGFLNTGMLKGTKAGTALLNAFINLGSKADKLSYSFGVVIDPTKPLDFIDVMNQLHNKIGEHIEEQKVMTLLWQIFGRRGGRAISTILSKWEQFKQSIESLDPEDIAGYTEKLEELASDNLNAKVTRLTNSIVALWDAIARGKPGEAASWLVEGLEKGIDGWRNRIQYLYGDLTELEYLTNQIKIDDFISEGSKQRTIDRISEIQTALIQASRNPIVNKLLVGTASAPQLPFLLKSPTPLQPGKAGKPTGTWVEPGASAELAQDLDKEQKRHALAMARLKSAKEYLKTLKDQIALGTTELEREKLRNRYIEAKAQYEKLARAEARRAGQAELDLIRKITEAQDKERQKAADERGKKALSLIERREHRRQIAVDAMHQAEILQMQIDGASEQEIIERKIQLIEESKLDPNTKIVEKLKLQLQLIQAQDRALTEQDRLYNRIGDHLGRGISDSMVLAVTKGATRMQKLQVWNRMGQSIGDTVGAIMAEQVAAKLALQGALGAIATGGIMGLVSGGIGMLTQLLFPVDNPIDRNTEATEEAALSIRELNDTMKTFQERYINAPSTFALGSMSGGLNMGEANIPYISNKTYSQSQSISIAPGAITVNAQPGQDGSEIADQVISKIYDRGGQYSTGVK